MLRVLCKDGGNISHHCSVLTSLSFAYFMEWDRFHSGDCSLIHGDSFAWIAMRYSGCVLHLERSYPLAFICTQQCLRIHPHCSILNVRQEFQNKLNPCPCEQFKHRCCSDLQPYYMPKNAYHMTIQHPLNSTCNHTAPIHSKNASPFFYLVRGISKGLFYFDVCAVSSSQALWNTVCLAEAGDGFLHFRLCMQNSTAHQLLEETTGLSTPVIRYQCQTPSSWGSQIHTSMIHIG